ncbi:MAG TPA: glutamate synthase large subunit, partial [Thermoanaerobaculia bacterium]|nr:glutamate synthase large subunit [Thermoanaerobaculia bacterium]
MNASGIPPRQGLYDPFFEHDACGFGFVVDLNARPSHDIIRKALQVLLNLEHRGASGSEKDTGDGAGLLTQIPHPFLAARCKGLGVTLPDPGAYGVGMLFLPTDAPSRQFCERRLGEIAREEGLEVLGWRDVPTDDATLGPTARASQPVIRQAFVVPRAAEATLRGDTFERKLYVVRRLVEKAVSRSALPGRADFYVSSLSHRTIVYKGMLNANQLSSFYPDLNDEGFAAALAMVHSRFSTNTFPSWSRAHPYRYISHNGEINTLRGNVNWMQARQRMFESRLFGDDLKKILPVIDLDGSDSSMFDNVLELLLLAGRSLPHALAMMIPEPWSKHESMSPELKAFYEFHSCFMEPWDGPASIAFTDGTRIGAILDRNGLRPSRWLQTKDGLVVMASESGVLDIPPEKVVKKGRSRPGRIFLVDLDQKRIIPDREIKDDLANAAPYALWLEEHLVRLRDLPEPPAVIEPDHETVLRRQETFGYTLEDVRMLNDPMAASGTEPLGSMGIDVPLAVLSEEPQLLYDYFKQLFAQVTNPPVDADRETIVMAVDTAIGPEENLLEPTPRAALHFELGTPFLRNAELEKIRALDGKEGSKGFKAITLPMLFKVHDGGKGLRKGVEDLRRRASEAIAEGHNILILSDRGHDETDAPIPALLALAAVQHHLLREGSRTRVGLVIESGEPREVHHFCLLIGYGASAINPYLAFETIHDQVRQGILTGSAEEAEKRYIKAVAKGLVKVISKMGISTVQSYHGAQVFEALGLSQDFIDEYFTGTPTRIGGVGIDVIGREVRLRHDWAYPKRPVFHTTLGTGGRYHYRRDGEEHLNTPETIHFLQAACRTGDFKLFKKYSDLVNRHGKHPITLRALLDFRPLAKPVPLDEVEPLEAILKRFKTGAMSYGSISQEAHEALAIAMNRIGGKSNTGEGGEDPARYEPLPNGDSKNSAIKQVASGRFGVTSQYLVKAQELQIKMAQGAKPGEGGQLPGHKVYPWIAKVRHATPGVGLISPPPHHDIYSIEDLAQLIYDLKQVNAAEVSVKLVAAGGVGTIAAGVVKALADVVHLSGANGG